MVLGGGGGVWGYVSFCVLVIGSIGFTLFFAISFFVAEYSDYAEYREFCEERPSFCYCSFMHCEFKISWSSLHGSSEDTKDICKLAKELNDKSMIFDVCIEEN